MRFESRVDVPPAVYIDSPEKAEAALRRCFASSFLAIDTETLGIQYGSMGDQILNVGLCPDKGCRFFVPRTYLYRFKCLIEDKEIVKIFSNYKFDAHRFANAGIEVNGPIADTVIMDWLHDEDTREGKHSLKFLSKDYLGITMDSWKEIVGRNNPADILPGHEMWPRMLDYGTLDVWATLEIFFLLREWLSNSYTDRAKTATLMDLYWRTEEPQLRCLYRMEREGILVDQDFLKSVGEELDSEMFEIAATLNHMAGKAINIQSTKQISEYLFKDLGLEPVKRTPSGAPSCDEEALTALALQGVEFCGVLLEYRERAKAKNTYVDGLIKRISYDGKLHTEYSPTKRTGRLGSKNPNLQNIPNPAKDPRKIRKAFIADDGCVLIVADYGQLEFRVLAHFSGDDAMIAGIRDGRDMHSYTGALMMDIPYEEFVKRRKDGDQTINAMRAAAKAIGFGIAYGMGVYTLASRLSDALGKEVSVEEAQEYLDQYWAAFPMVKPRIEAFKKSARTRGYVETITGRRRRLSGAKSGSFRMRKACDRQAVNAPIQGSAHDIVKHAMIRCSNDSRLRELGVSIRLQVHDELVFNCPKENAEQACGIIQAHMEDPLPFEFAVPLTAEPMIVNNWAEAK